MLLAIGARSRRARAENKPVARLPVVLQGASSGPASRQRVAPGEGRRPPASRSPNMSCLRARLGGPDARTRQIRILNLQRDLLTARNQSWQGGVLKCADTDGRRGQ